MNTERIKAIIVIVVTAIVNILNVYGYAVDMDATVNGVLSLFSAATIIYSWWFNQNVTSAAQEGQRVVNAIKAIKKDTGLSLSAEMALELTGGVDHDVQQAD